MRVTVLANRDVHACVALNLLAPALAAHEVTLLLSDAVGGARPTLAPLALLKRAEQEVPVGDVFPAAEAMARAAEQELRTFAQLGVAACEAFNAPNTPEGVARLRATRPDVMLSLRYGRRLQPAAIAVSARGVLNLHSGFLPQYRGVLATLRALLAGEREVGCTLHWITDAGIDTGAMIAQSRTPVVPGCSLFDAIQSVYPDGCALLADALTTIAAGGTLPAIVAADEGAYYSWPGAEEFARLAAQGHSVVDVATWSALMRRFLPPGSPFVVPALA